MPLLRKNTAAAFIGMSRGSLEKIIKTDPTFPRPIKLGEHRQSTVLFDEAELAGWVQSLKARRDAMASNPGHMNTSHHEAKA